jgi:hypothetical protein
MKNTLGGVDHAIGPARFSFLAPPCDMGILPMYLTSRSAARASARRRAYHDVSHLGAIPPRLTL